MKSSVRLAPWMPEDLREHLCEVADRLVERREGSDVSPLDVALELLGDEVEAFVLFVRMGHLDPPRPDGSVPIGVLRRRSEDPEIDVRIRETAKKWAFEQEGRS